MNTQWIGRGWAVGDQISIEEAVDEQIKQWLSSDQTLKKQWMSSEWPMNKQWKSSGMMPDTWNMIIDTWYPWSEYIVRKPNTWWRSHPWWAAHILCNLKFCVVQPYQEFFSRKIRSLVCNLKQCFGNSTCTMFNGTRLHRRGLKS